MPRFLESIKNQASREEVERKLAELDATASMTRMREELRDIYAEVRAIADQVVDPQLKARITALSERARGARPVPLESVSSPLTKRELDVRNRVEFVTACRREGLIP